MVPSNNSMASTTLALVTGMEKRGLGGPLDNSNIFSNHQTLILQVLSIVSACISIIAALTATYWFFRMRRTYRHHLIMLLIYSDMFKAIWYLIYPAIALVQGPLPSSSAFCQTSGFFLALALEASDFAILMIAVHAALYIFRPNTSVGEAGLYRYRYLAYALWIVFPVLMASLAFVNPMNPYVTSGTYCYLPVRPFWYRLALSWIPRYLIILTITGLYLAIYIYVKLRFRGFQSDSDTSFRNSTLVPTEDPIALQQKFPPGAGESSIVPPHNPSIALSTVSEGPTLTEPSFRHNSAPVSVPWENYAFGSTSQPLPQTDGTTTLLHRVSLPASLANRNSCSLIQALHTEPPPIFALDGAAISPFMAASLAQRHHMIKRHIRLLFIYPLVYTLTFLLPFINHCFLYSDTYASRPIYLLACFNTCILALQCAIDAALFTAREKPWRHIAPDSSLTARLAALRDYFRPDLTGPVTPSPGPADTANPLDNTATISPLSKPARPPLHRNTSSNPRIPRTAAGLSRGEMKGEAAVAQARLDKEREGEEVRRRERTERRKRSLAQRGGRERSWWEVEGRWRRDSVLLGTETGKAGSSSGSGSGEKVGHGSSGRIEEGVER